MSTPVGPYSPSVTAGPWVVCSGQLGIRAGDDGPALVEGGLAQQTRQALANARELLEEHGLGWGQVVKTTAFLADIADYAAFNEVYLEAIGDYRPARSVVAVAGLPMGALVEVEVWAFRG